jgi:hypothetical protein
MVQSNIAFVDFIPPYETTAKSFAGRGFAGPQGGSQSAEEGAAKQQDPRQLMRRHKEAACA